MWDLFTEISILEGAISFLAYLLMLFTCSPLERRELLNRYDKY